MMEREKVVVNQGRMGQLVKAQTSMVPWECRCSRLLYYRRRQWSIVGAH